MTVAEITGKRGPESTHIAIGSESGLRANPLSWINVTGIHTVPKGKLRRHRGRLAPAELARVNSAVRPYLDVEPL